MLVQGASLHSLLDLPLSTLVSKVMTLICIKLVRVERAQRVLGGGSYGPEL